MIIMDFDRAPSFVDTVIGPDFPGYTIKHLRNLLDKDGEPEGIFMFAQGCCGDINGFPLRGGFDACDAAALSLASAITRALAKPKIVPPALLKSHSLVLSEPNGPLALQPFPMRAFVLGDEMCFLTLPRAPYSEYQLFADRISLFKDTLVFGYTNGTGQYVLPGIDCEKPIKEGITHLLHEAKSAR